MDYIAIVIFVVLLVFIAFVLRKNGKHKRQLDAYANEVMHLGNKIGSLTYELEQKKKNCAKDEILARLVTQSPNAIMLMDKAGNIDWINEGFEKMYEYSYEEFTRKLGKNYRQTSFSPDVESRLRFIGQTKQPFRYEAPNVTRTGRSLWTQTALMPILGPDGEITHMATIDTDIHQRVLASENVIMEMEELDGQIDHLEQQFRSFENEFVSLFQSISEMYSLIDKTDEILQFIKDISDKTRILGFNASIEANRAGEHGRGFRVITNEIVDISDKTIRSVREIHQIINSLKDKQSEMASRKDGSESRMTDYQNVFTVLKKELHRIEQAIEEFKSLA